MITPINQRILSEIIASLPVFWPDSRPAA
jgi:hypothetical protein